MRLIDPYSESYTEEEIRIHLFQTYKHLAYVEQELNHLTHEIRVLKYSFDSTGLIDDDWKEIMSIMYSARIT